MTAWSRSLGRGLAAGLTLGVAYRAWMRLVTTDPHFSWSGTLAIIASVTVVAVLASLSDTARRRYRRRGARAAVRIAAGASFVLIGAGPGMLTVPIWLPGSLAWSRTTWPRWSRRLLWGASAAGFALFVVVAWSDLAELGAVRGTLGLAAFPVIMAAIARLFAWPTGESPGTV